MLLNNSVRLICASLLLFGCGKMQFEDEHGQQWIGKSMTELQLAYGPPDGRRTNQQHQIEYFHNLNRGYGPCTLYWIVNDSDKILDWRHEGKGCTKAWSLMH